MTTNFSLLQIAFVFIGLGVLSILGSFIIIPSQRERVIAYADGTFSQKDLGYFNNTLWTLSEIIKRFLVPIGAFSIVGITFAFFFINADINVSFILLSVVKIILIVLPLLISVAYLTLLERKVMAAMQRRKGPGVVGVFGLLQPLADGAKLLLKETVIPNSINKTVFFIAPILTFFLAVMSWAVIPFEEGIVYADINIGVLYLFAVSSLGVYGVICSGWSSNTKYSFLGALRSSAQMISYEIAIGFLLLMIFLLAGSLNMTAIVLAQKGVWFCIPLLPSIMIWFVCILAETNRAPFDLPEAEAELVAGYFTEYSAMGFALFFLGEYSNMIMMSALTSLCFFGGWLPLITMGPSLIPGTLWMGIKITAILFGFIWVRAAFPRYRFDQLMYLGWKSFLPFVTGWFIFVAGLLFGCDWLPY